MQGGKYPDHHFPDKLLRKLRLIPGNHKCCDCASLDTDWASVSHGTLICLECAGKHRSLGVQVSFVRSIRMDSWTPKQVSAAVATTVTSRPIRFPLTPLSV